MAAFQLDTSGVVTIPRGRNGILAPRRVKWSDLSPFTQGYIEAAAQNTAKRPAPPLFGFSDLAPETLAQMIADCEARMASDDCVQNVRAGGRSFWARRQIGDRHGFPPLTLSLGDDGRIYVKGSTQ